MSVTPSSSQRMARSSRPNPPPRRSMSLLGSPRSPRLRARQEGYCPEPERPAPSCPPTCAEEAASTTATPALRRQAGPDLIVPASPKSADASDLVVPTSPKSVDAPDLVVPTSPKPADTPDLVVPASPKSADASDLVVPTSPKSADASDLMVPASPKFMDALDLVVQASPKPADTPDLVVQASPKSADTPDLVVPASRKSPRCSTPRSPPLHRGVSGLVLDTAASRPSMDLTRRRARPSRRP
jgi:hypothetical protein